MSLIMVLKSGNVGQRYLMPFYMICFLLFASVLISIKHNTLKTILLSIVFLSLFSGHLWIYPERYSQSWDASLAHLPYFELRDEAAQYLNENKIDFDNVATGFPTFNSLYLTDFKNDKNIFCQLTNEVDNYSYVLDSNIQNTLLPKTREKLRRNENFEVIWHNESKGVWMTIYKNKK